MSTSSTSRNPDRGTIDRNWNELLQEIRVAETGVQILTGFLLTVPFTQRFGDLNRVQRTSYLAVLCGSVLTTALVVAPVAFHRILFRHRARLWLVMAANRCARAGLILMAVTTSGTIFLVFDVVEGTTTALVAFAVALGYFGSLWGLVPLVSQHRERPESPADPED